MRLTGLCLALAAAYWTTTGCGGGSKRNGVDAGGADTGVADAAQRDGTSDSGSSDAAPGDGAAPQDGGTNTVTGSVDGHSVQVQAVVYCPSGFGDPDDLTVILTDRADECDNQKNNATGANQTALTLHLVQVSVPGNFQVVTGNATAGQALVTLTETGASCAATYFADGTSGNITVTAVDISSNGSIAGTFSVNFAGGQLTGSFDTTTCMTGYYCGTGASCQP